MLEALAARRSRLEAELPLQRRHAESVLASPGKPDSVAEHFLLSQSMIRGEIAWVDEVSQRVRSGRYVFTGEHTSALAALRDDGMDVSVPPMGSRLAASARIGTTPIWKARPNGD